MHLTGEMGSPTTPRIPDIIHIDWLRRPISVFATGVSKI